MAISALPRLPPKKDVKKKVEKCGLELRGANTEFAGDSDADRQSALQSWKKKLNRGNAFSSPLVYI